MGLSKFTFSNPMKALRLSIVLVGWVSVILDVVDSSTLVLRGSFTHRAPVSQSNHSPPMRDHGRNITFFPKISLQS